MLCKTPRRTLVSNPKGIKFYANEEGAQDKADLVSNPKGIKFYNRPYNTAVVVLMFQIPKG